MGEVIALIRMMPDGVLEDDQVESITTEVKEVIKKPAKLERFEVKALAFGLRGFDVTITVPDGAGGVDDVVKALEGVKMITNVEVVDMGRI